MDYLVFYFYPIFLLFINQYQNLMNFCIKILQLVKSPRAQCSDNLDHTTPIDKLAVEDQYVAHTPERRQRVPNFEQFFSPVQIVTQNTELIKGFKFQIALPLSEYFHVLNTWTFPNTGNIQEDQQRMRAGAPIRPNFALTAKLLREIKKEEPQTIMVGKIDNEGKLDAIIFRKLMKNISLKLSGSFHSSNIDEGITSAEVQIEGKDYTSLFKVGQGYMGLNHMQRLNGKLLIGFDYMNLRAQKISYFGYGAKLYLQKHSLFARFNTINNQFNLGYIIPIKQGTQFVAQYTLDSRQNDSKTTLGFKQSYSDSSITATVNTKGEISTCLSLNNPSFSLKLSALADYIKERYSFGYGITLGQVA